MLEHTIITISRQYGSGGREISKKLSNKLGIPCYDRKIVYMAAEKMGSSQDDIESVLEMAYRTPESRISSVGEYGFEIIPYYNKMYREQAKLIREIAQRGSAIFLGRCAEAILKDFSQHYSFYIYADEKYRENRAKDYYNNLSIKELNKENKIKEQYYNYYTGKKWGNPQNYDLMINTSNFSLEDAADLVICYIEKRQKKTEQ